MNFFSGVASGTVIRASDTVITTRKKMRQLHLCMHIKFPRLWVARDGQEERDKNRDICTVMRRCGGAY